LAHNFPQEGGRVYSLKWRGGARFIPDKGTEHDAEVHVQGRFLLEPAGPCRWQGRFESATQQVTSPPETGVRPDPAALAGVVFLLEVPSGEKPRASAQARPPSAVLPLLSPKTAIVLASFPPLPEGRVKRGARWESEAAISWPHPEGDLAGTARLRMRLFDLRSANGRTTALVRIWGDLELRRFSHKSQPFRGEVKADVQLDVEEGVVRRAVVEEDWLGRVRDGTGKEVELKTTGEWEMELAS
jgi:hypothetical protein